MRTAREQALQPFRVVPKTNEGFGSNKRLLARTIAPRTRDLPGIQWILLGLYLNFALVCRPVLYHWGIPLPMRLVSQIGNPIVLLLFAIGGYQYAKSQHVHLLLRESPGFRIRTWFCIIAFLSVYGVIHGNEWITIGKEAIAFSTMGIFLLVGEDECFWYGLEKHLTVLFYLGFALMYVYYQSPTVTVTSQGVLQDFYVTMDPRYTGSLAYPLRPLVAPGLLLGIWGLVRRSGGIWRILQILALPALFACEANLFKFRSSAAFALLAALSFLVLGPLLERRIRLFTSVFVLAVGTLGLLYYLPTKSGQILETRVTVETKKAPLFGSRLAELEAYLADMGPEAVVGRGLGGTFDASRVYGPNMGRKWAGLHFGVLVFTLKGGLPFLLAFLSFIRPGFAWRDPFWYRNPCDLTAALLFPVYCCAIIFNPIHFSPEMALYNLPVMMVLARSARQKHCQSILRP